MHAFFLQNLSSGLEMVEKIKFMTFSMFDDMILQQAGTMATESCESVQKTNHFIMAVGCSS